MGKPSKPCDVKDRWPKLPCIAPGGELCYGRLCWDKKRDQRPRPIRYMTEGCPWIERVREHWRRKGY